MLAYFLFAITRLWWALLETTSQPVSGGVTEVVYWYIVYDEVLSYQLPQQPRDV